MKYVYLILNWLFGVIFLLLGLVMLFSSPLAGLSLLGCGALLLPPIRNFAFEKTNKQIPIKARTILISVLFIGFVVATNHEQSKKLQIAAEKKAEEVAAQQKVVRQKKIDEFNKNRQAIILSVKDAFVKKDFKSVLNQSNKYLVAGDKELNQLNTQAKDELAKIATAKKKELAKIAKAEKIQKLLTELKSIPSQEFENNFSRYQQLVKLEPNNSVYKEKAAYYSAKIEEDKQKRLVAEERKKKIERQFSAWDGAHNNLEKVVKEAMNDPDSYDHAKTVYWDKGSYLIVQTTFRGKNAFGGVIKNTVKAKVSLNGQILEIIEQY